MKLTLIERKETAPDTTSFIFKSEDPNFTWLAGQFLKYHIEDPSPDSRKNDRFFTIASSPLEKVISLTTKFVPDDGSSFKKDLQNFKVGDTIEARGPGGDFIIEDPEKSYVFVAGGIGITPFRSIIKDLDLKNSPINITLLYASRAPEVAFKDELEEIAKRHPEFKIHYAIDPQKIDETFIKQKVADLQTPIFFVSGPEPMVEALEKLLLEMGVKDEKVKRDYFPGYDWP